MSFTVFAGIDWWYHNRGHIDAQLARRFAEIGQTLLINCIVMQKFNLGRGKRFWHRVIRKTKSICTGLKRVNEGFWVYSPFTLPVHHIRWAKRMNDLVLRLQVGHVSRKLGISSPVVLVACPAACDVAIKMDKSKLIYQRTDRFEATPGVDAGVITEYDRRLKANSDLTIFVSRELFNRESCECKNPFFLDHGVDFDMFASVEKDPIVPPDIAAIPHPIVGYFGAIESNSVDIALTERIAELLPEMSFVYVGSATPDFSDLKGKKNVWMLGQKDYCDIPRYGRHFDVAIIPWRHNRWTHAANPIKVKEYLALGKPIVSTPAFTQIEEYPDVMYVANSAEEFARSIERAIAEDSREQIATRRKKVERDTWDMKAQVLLDTLFRGNSSI